MNGNNQDLDQSKANQNLWFKRINPGIVAALAIAIAFSFLILFFYLIASHYKENPDTVSTTTNLLMTLSVVIPFMIFPILMITFIQNKVDPLI